MVIGILVPLAFIGILVLVAVLVFQRGREGTVFTSQNLISLYLYVAKLAGLSVLVVGLSSLLNFGFASAFGTQFGYGGPIPGDSAFLARPCPPGVDCPETADLEAQQREQGEMQRRQQEQQRSEDLLRGITYTLLGLLFWGVHALAQRRFLATSPDDLLNRAYLIAATAVFGLAMLFMLPQGAYLALSYWLIPAVPGTYRESAGQPLAGGLVTLPFWLYYLRQVIASR